MARSLTEVPTSYRTLLEQPNLDAFDQIMIEHLGIEELYKLYTDNNREVFDQSSSLNRLAERFGLQERRREIETFADLLKIWDQTHATVRSYKYSHDPRQIVIRACEEGNIQAVVKGLKLYPELRTTHFYLECFYAAGYNHYPEIAELFLDLLGDANPGVSRSSFIPAAVATGSVEILRRALKLTEPKKALPHQYDMISSLGRAIKTR